MFSGLTKTVWAVLIAIIFTASVWGGCSCDEIQDCSADLDCACLVICHNPAINLPTTEAPLIKLQCVGYISENVAFHARLTVSDIFRPPLG